MKVRYIVCFVLQSETVQEGAALHQRLMNFFVKPVLQHIVNDIIFPSCVLN